MYVGAGTTSSSYGTGTSGGTGSRPGFWTGEYILECDRYYCFMFDADAVGAATGGMLGYLFGNRGK